MAYMNLPSLREHLLQIRLQVNPIGRTQKQNFARICKPFDANFGIQFVSVAYIKLQLGISSTAETPRMQLMD